MPRDGYASITVPNGVYDDLADARQDGESWAAFFTRLLEDRPPERAEISLAEPVELTAAERERVARAVRDELEALHR